MESLNSLCLKLMSFTSDIGTASLFKYIVNSFLATKVIAMNQYRALADSMGLDWSELAKMLAGDPRIGSSHLQVPGPDGQFGFGGMCFPKDIEALLILCRTAKY